MYSEAQKRATIKYKKEKLKRVAVELKIEDYEKLVEYANGRPLATVIKEIIFEKMQ